MEHIEKTVDIIHFGLKIKEKPTNHINKKIYLSAKPEGMRGWTDADYTKQIPKADYNYDLNMEYFKSLDFDDFNKYISKQCKKHKFVECFDLNMLKDISGVYMMVLDEYKQVYIGISNNIKQRIKGHWNNQKSLERLIFGDICSSILSIDSFGALDTTRIFYIKTFSTYKKEEEIVKAFDSKYMLNRTAGGIGSVETYTNMASAARLAVLANRKTRDFVDFVDVNKLKSIVAEKSFQYYLEKYPTLLKK